MEQEILNFISTFVKLTNEEEKFIIELDLIKKYEKGSILLREGEISKECYLVLRGCVRSYYLIDGEEKTTAFFTENERVNPISYNTKTPSEYYLSCTEESFLCSSAKEKADLLILNIPRLESIGNLLNEQQVIKSQLDFDSYKTLSPENRYLKLLDSRPQLCERVPQYYLASYLGIKPETLSRIRKRIVSKG